MVEGSDEETAEGKGALDNCHRAGGGWGGHLGALGAFEGDGVAKVASYHVSVAGGIHQPHRSVGTARVLYSHND